MPLRIEAVGNAPALSTNRPLCPRGVRLSKGFVEPDDPQGLYFDL